MSFNKIKPVYREMLMKLVMTMSKDEIFTRYSQRDGMGSGYPRVMVLHAPCIM
jgi:hypothetical protein